MSELYKVVMNVSPYFYFDFGEVTPIEERDIVFPKFNETFLAKFKLVCAIPISGYLLPSMEMASILYKTEAEARLAIAELPKKFPNKIRSATAEWELPKGEAF